MTSNLVKAMTMFCQKVQTMTLMVVIDYSAAAHHDEGKDTSNDDDLSTG